MQSKIEQNWCNSAVLSQSWHIKTFYFVFQYNARSAIEKLFYPSSVCLSRFIKCTNKNRITWEFFLCKAEYKVQGIIFSLKRYDNVKLLTVIDVEASQTSPHNNCASSCLEDYSVLNANE